MAYPAHGSTSWDSSLKTYINEQMPSVVLTSDDVDVTGVADCTSTVNSALASLDANRGGNVYLPNGKLYTASGFVSTIQGAALIGIEGQPGIDDTLSKGTTQVVVGDGVWGLTLGSSSATHWRGYRVSNIHFYEKNSGQALGGLRALRVCMSHFDRVAAGGFSGSGARGILLDGTGDNAQYNTFLDCRAGHCNIGYHQKAANGTRWLGGYMDGNSEGSFSIASGSLGMKLESGDTFRGMGVCLQGFDTLAEIGSNIGHEFYGLRVEVWNTAAVHVLGTGSGSRGAKIIGSGDNTLNGSVGAGVVIDSGASDTYDGMWIANVSAGNQRHVNNGTGTIILYSGQT